MFLKEYFEQIDFIDGTILKLVGSVDDADAEYPMHLMRLNSK